MRNVVVTGAKGFVGKNLIAHLKSLDDEIEIFEIDIDTDKKDVEEYIKHADYLFHLAGVNRPEKEEDFMKGNFGFTSEVLDILRKNNNKCTILITSSIQAALDNPYGNSKRAGEELLFEYSKETGAKVCVYRLPNVFGKWCRPNYNSVIATFCNNIAKNMEIIINDPNIMMNLVYIDDVCDEFIRALNNKENRDGDYCYVPVTYKITLGEIANTIKSFKESRTSLLLPLMGDELTKKLYSTYLSYLPEDKFSYELNTHKDDRGSFTEVFRTEERGQFSINVIKPGITKGQHWHHTKNEKFIVVAGKGMIRLRKIDEEKIIEYEVSSDKLEVIDIPVGYTHSIVNTSESDMIVMIWANELFDKEKPDTFYMEV